MTNCTKCKVKLERYGRGLDRIDYCKKCDLDYCNLGGAVAVSKHGENHWEIKVPTNAPDHPDHYIPCRESTRFGKYPKCAHCENADEVVIACSAEYKAKMEGRE